MCVVTIVNDDLKTTTTTTYCADPMDGVGIVYTVEQDDWEDLKEDSHPPVLQRLLLFLFLQHSDPFNFRLSDIMGERPMHVHSMFYFPFAVLCYSFDFASATEVLLERHLEDIVNHNRQAVVPSFETEIKNALELQNRRKKVSLLEPFCAGCKSHQ